MAFDVNSLGGKLIDNQELAKLIGEGGGSSGGGITRYYISYDVNVDTNDGFSKIPRVFKNKPTPTIGNFYENANEMMGAYGVTWAGDELSAELLYSKIDSGEFALYTLFEVIPHLVSLEPTVSFEPIVIAENGIIKYANNLEDGLYNFGLDKLVLSYDGLVWRMKSDGGIIY